MTNVDTRNVPMAKFQTRVRDDALEGPNPFDWKEINSDDVFKGKRIVLFPFPALLHRLVRQAIYRDMKNSMEILKPKELMR
jgi:hypothetical protein